jgi:hypothetical protein
MICLIDTCEQARPQCRQAICFSIGAISGAMIVSALQPQADMCSATREIRFGPKADILGIHLRWY